MKSATAIAVLVLSSLLGFGVDPQPYPKLRPLQFSHQPTSRLVRFQTSSPDNSYLTRLRTEYEIDRLVAGRKSDYEKLRALASWTHSRWEQSGESQAERPDPISILDEARLGRDFRSVEYSTVLRAALNSVGIPARVLNLMMEDVETRGSAASHVVVEAYIFSLKKWVMIDPQWGVVPTLDGKPLNAVELQHALALRSSGLLFDTVADAAPPQYAAWIAPYLFYFQISFDERFPKPQESPSLVLAPIGYGKVTVLQPGHPSGNNIYTHSLSDFYPAPAMSL